MSRMRMRMLGYVLSDSEGFCFCSIIGLELALTPRCQDAKDGRSSFGIRLTGLVVNKRKRQQRGKILFFVDSFPTNSSSIHQPFHFYTHSSIQVYHLHPYIRSKFIALFLINPQAYWTHSHASSLPCVSHHFDTRQLWTSVSTSYLPTSTSCNLQ